MAGESRTTPDRLNAPRPERAGAPAPRPPAPVQDAGALERLRAWAEQRAQSELIARLEDEPWRFDFFTVVRRLEAMNPDRPRMGFSQRPSEDPVRFAQEPSLAFAPCTVQRYRGARGNSPSRLFVNFMGLLGPNGPLPLHLTEHAMQRERHAKDPTFSRFLDVFNHRMICLFYRGWVSSNQAALFDRGWPMAGGERGWARRVPIDRGPENDALERLQSPPASARGRFGWDDRFAMYVGSLFGLGMNSLRERDRVPDVGKLHFAGWLAGQTRSAEGLEKIVGTYFGIPTRVVQFVGRWVAIPDESRLRLGESQQTGLLGTTAVIGSRFWDCSSGFRLEMGPMNLSDYERLLPVPPPGGENFGRLVDWVRTYAGDALFWDVRLTLRASQVPGTTLGGGNRLGWTTWMMKSSGSISERDRGDLVLRPCGDQ